MKDDLTIFAIGNRITHTPTGRSGEIVAVRFPLANRPPPHLVPVVFDLTSEPELVSVVEIEHEGTGI